MEDLISRQAAKRALEDRFIELQKRHDDKRYETNYCLNTILELPPVTRLSKTGHWTIKQYQVPIENKQVPTVSGITFPTEPTACKIICTFTHSDCKSEEYLNKYNYCPNCGCRMIDP